MLLKRPACVGANYLQGFKVPKGQVGDEVEQGQTLSGLRAKDFTLQATVTQDSFTL